MNQIPDSGFLLLNLQPPAYSLQPTALIFIPQRQNPELDSKLKEMGSLAAYAKSRAKAYWTGSGFLIYIGGLTKYCFKIIRLAKTWRNKCINF